MISKRSCLKKRGPRIYARLMRIFNNNIKTVRELWALIWWHHKEAIIACLSNPRRRMILVKMNGCSLKRRQFWKEINLRKETEPHLKMTPLYCSLQVLKIAVSNRFKHRKTSSKSSNTCQRRKDWIKSKRENKEPADIVIRLLLMQKLIFKNDKADFN